MVEQTPYSTTPLFRWPGSKWHLAERVQPMLSAHVDSTGGRLLSCFFGSGALERAVDPRSVLAADANAELRALYAELARDGGRDTHAALLALDNRAPRSRETYLAIRASDPGALSPAERAARFLWISCLAFNGLWRVNRAGGLNVPPDPRRLAQEWPFPTAERLASAAAFVPAAPLFDDWRTVVRLARPGDVVLADPPYLGAFDAYTASRFPLVEQHQLATALRHAARRGVAVIAFNSLEAHGLFRTWARVETVLRPGRMNCRGDRRQPVGELLVTVGLHGSRVVRVAG